MDNLQKKIPQKFWDRMRGLLKDDFDSFYDSYGTASCTEDAGNGNMVENLHALRLNPLKCDDVLEEEITQRFCRERVPWCEDGYYYEGDAKPGKSVLHEMGLFYIQEPSAMVVGSLLNAKPGEKILDLCAAPGGKTTHIAGQMRGEGLLVSNEIDYTRAKILSRNVERMGVTNCIVTNNTPDELSALFEGFFDRIVVDSPCSGEGMFKKEEAAVSCWSEDNVFMCAERSKKIVDEAVKMLASGGVLVYSTCTFAVEEDEYIIKYILEKYPYMKLDRPEKPELFEILSGPVCERAFFDSCCEGDPAVYRIWPHRQKGEGHFAARLVKSRENLSYQGALIQDAAETLASGLEKHDRPDPKTGGKYKKDNRAVRKNRKNDPANTKSSWALTKNEQRIAEEFFTEVFTSAYSESWGENFHLFAGKPQNTIFSQDPGRLRKYGDTIRFVATDTPACLKTLRNGIELGTVKKDRFEPSHALALAVSAKAVKNSFETDTPDSFIAGNTLCCDPALTGWVLVTYKGFSLGWGKASGGVIKNHYPKGLRRTVDV